jgi:hypothetical protein
MNLLQAYSGSGCVRHAWGALFVTVRVCSQRREKRRPSVGALCSDLPRIADE